LVGIICFLCPGMFNALNSLQQETEEVKKLKSLQTGILYAFFAVFSLVAGGLNNILGPRVLLAFASSTYALFQASKLSIHLQDLADMKSGQRQSTNTIDGTRGFAYGAGALLGIGAGCLWAAQGAIVMTYPTDNRRGTYFAYFWIIFNLGAVIGSMIAFAESSSTVPTELYVTFMCLSAGGAVVALVIAPPRKVIREDNTNVTQRDTNVWQEVKSIMLLFTNPAMLVLVIPFASSNWFYQYQFTNFQAYFTEKTQALNNIFFWGSQMAASWFFSNGFLDELRYGGRKQRAWTGLSIVAVCTTCIWGFGGVFQWYIDPGNLGTYRNIYNETAKNAIDFQNTNGMYDAFFQAYTYWLLGSLSHDAAINSRYAGFYKSIQSLFGAISW
ncbi:hypothetical protein BCR33DRAFT_639605, partial [Rhizoclosmatium globosum]